METDDFVAASACALLECAILWNAVLVAIIWTSFGTETCRSNWSIYNIQRGKHSNWLGR